MHMKKFMYLILFMVLLAFSGLCNAAAPTFQELMNPAIFPQAQQGMKVETATVSENALHVVTTGAELTLNKKRPGCVSATHRP